MRLPSVKDLSVANKKVLLRTNYDVPLLRQPADQGKLLVADATRIEESLPTINYLLSQKAKVIIVSHLGRPGGKIVLELSLRSVAEEISNFQFSISNKFSISNFQTGEFKGWKLDEQVVLLENLRFYPEEEANDLEFAKKLASLGDFYVNDAFACSHRKHASVVGIPKFLPVSRRAFGFDFLEEVKALTKIKDNPRRPVVVILGGVKKNKIEAAKKLVFWADHILVGGKLVEYDGIPNLIKHPKIDADLIKDGQDITMETVKKFKKIIAKAGTVVWAGPMGNFYDKKHERGTREIAEAIVKSGAFSVVGGGDTEAALTKFGLDKKIDFISSGGGAMLAFLAEGTLPGIEAIKNG